MAKQYTFYALLSRMKLIERWSLMRSTTKETLMEHAALVGIIGQALGIIRNIKFGGDVDVDLIASLALYHDTAEVVSGDLPTPIKYYNPKIKETYSEIESIIIDKLVDSLPDDMQNTYESLLRPDTSTLEYKLMKIADKMSALLKCIEEKASGNTEFDKAYNRIMKDLQQYVDEYPEVQYFLDNFVASFGKQVDIL